MITYVSNSALANSTLANSTLANSTLANSALVIKSDDKIVVGKEISQPSLLMLLPTELLELWQ